MVGLVGGRVHTILDRARRGAAVTRQRNDAVSLELLQDQDRVFVDLPLPAEIDQQTFQRFKLCCPVGAVRCSSMTASEIKRLRKSLCILSKRCR